MSYDVGPKIKGGLKQNVKENLWLDLVYTIHTSFGSKQGRFM